MAAENCIVIGAGGQCRVVLSLLREPGNKKYFPKGILDLNADGNGENILGVPVLGHVKNLSSYYAEGIKSIFLAIGDNKEREKYYELVVRSGFDLPNLISVNAYVSPDAILANANIVSPFVHIGPLVEIGNNNIINTHVNLEHETVIGSHCHFSPSSVVSGRTCIGDRVFLGLGAKVIDKIKISSDTTVGAGGIVIEDIGQPGGVYVGVPVRKIKG